MSTPAVPSEIPKEALTDTELGELWHQICVEIMNEKFAGRMHGNRRTYDAGCQGPMCKKASREHGRRRVSAAPSAKYQHLDLVIEAWGPIARDRVETARARLLEEIAPAS